MMEVPNDTKDMNNSGMSALEHVVAGSVKAIQHVLEKGNEIVDGHRDWLADFPLLDQGVTSQTVAVTVITPIFPTSTQLSARFMITPAPELRKREALPEPQAASQCDCNSQINVFKSQASSQRSQDLSQATSNFQKQSTQLAQQASQSIGQAQSLQSSAQTAASLAQTAASSANATASSAQVDASSARDLAAQASASLSSIQTSASLAVTSAQSSADSAVSAASAGASSSMSIAMASAMSSASLAISSASSSLSVATASASLAVANAVSSASLSASNARATATVAIAQAQATISLANSQASASVRSSQVQAITATQAAIAIVGSIIGSSFLSILAYFLLTRYRKRKQMQEEEEEVFEVFEYDEKGQPISPQNRAFGPQQPRASYIEPPSEFEYEPKRNKFFSFRSSKGPKSDASAAAVAVPETVSEEEPGEAKPRPSLGGGKRALVYDSDRPDAPPIFDTGEELGDIEDEEERRRSALRDAQKTDASGRSLTSNSPKIGAAV